MPVVHENVVHTVSQILTMVWLVSARRGVAFVPQSTSLLGIDGVEYLPLRTTSSRPVELHLLWPKDSPNPALGVALDALASFS